MTVAFGLFGLAVVIGMVGVGWVIHRDLTVRGIDPVPVLVWMFVFWPYGGYLWHKKRSENAHPTLRA